MSATRLAVRGFHEKSPETRDRLERIGVTFLAGFAYAAQAASPDEAGPRLESLQAPVRGFGYEGAAMAFAIVDALSIRSWRVQALLAGYARRHIYMTYVGLGWAMARLPRPFTPRLYAPDPLLRWLVLDGYGFHQAYFRTERYVRRQTPIRPPWPKQDAESHYPSRVADQGIGRALWFVGGADVACVADFVDRFAPSRHGDLYSGVGLAATYAGGADERELRVLRTRAGAHRAQLAQGSAFAAKARVLAELSTPETEMATGVLCGMSPDQAAKVTDEACPDTLSESPALGRGDCAYERWRSRIAEHFAEAS